MGQMPVQWLLETKGSYDLDPVYFPTHLFPGVHRDHVGLGQEKVSRKGQILSLLWRVGQGRVGEGRRRSPAHLPVLGREPRVAG